MRFRSHGRVAGGAIVLAALLAIPVLGAGAPSGPRGAPNPGSPGASPSPWTNLTPSPTAGPPTGPGDEMVNDTSDGYVLWFGGHGPGGVGLTWTWNGGVWTNRTGSLSVSPPARSFAVLVFDPIVPEVVLFGGLGDPSYLNDTWAYNAGTWTNVTPLVGRAPSARAESAATYDPNLSGLLLFGGVGKSVLSDTWSFAGGHWSAIVPIGQPPALCCGALAYDGLSDVSVLVVSNATAGLFLTWQYASGVWSNLTKPISPSPRFWPSLVTDRAVGGLLLFGGSSIEAPPYWPLGDAWLFAGGNWSRGATTTGNATEPLPRWAAAIAPLGPASSNTSCFLLVGGGGTNGSLLAADSVWEGCGNRTAWTSSGGSGTGGVPPMVGLTASPLQGVVPYGSTVTVTVANGSAPFLLSFCTTTAGCRSLPGWSGSPPYRTVVNVTAPGQLGVTALVQDRNGLSGSATLTLTGSRPTNLVAHPTISPARGIVPLTVGFFAAVSGGVPPYAIQWEFGDGATAPGSPNVTLHHTYTAVGGYFPRLVVSDAVGDSVNVSVPTGITVVPPSLSVGPPPSPLAIGTLEGPIAILAVGVAAAAAIYAVRRRTVLTQADATIREVRGDRSPPEAPPGGDPPPST